MEEFVELGLAEAVVAIRDELQTAREMRERGTMQFTVGPVEVEFAVVVKKNAGGRVGVQLGVATVGANGGVAQERTHRVKVTLTPVDPQSGRSVKINTSVTEIPGY